MQCSVDSETADIEDEKVLGEQFKKMTYQTRAGHLTKDDGGNKCNPIASWPVENASCFEWSSVTECALRPEQLKTFACPSLCNNMTHLYVACSYHNGPDQSLKLMYRCGLHR
jgi:hypothetical protein